MALTITHLAHGTYGGGDFSLGTVSVTPAPNSLLLLTVRGTAAGSTPNDADSASAFGATWSRVGSACYSTSARLVVMKAQMGASPGSGGIFYTWSRVENASFPFMYSIDQITGHDVNAPIRQAVFGSPSAGQVSGTLIGATLAAPKDTDSRTLGFFTLLSPVSNLNTQPAFTSLLANYTGGTSNERLHLITSSPSWQAQTIVTNDTTAFPIYGAIEVVAAQIVTVIGPGADTGGLTDASSLNVLGTDTYTVTESGLLVATAPAGVDGGGFTEAGNVYVPVEGGDFGYLDEEGVLTAVPFAAPDIGAFTDDAAVAATVPAGADTTHLADAATAPAATLTAADTAAVTEAGQVVALVYLAGADTAAIVDDAAAPSDLHFPADADTATAVDAATAPVVTQTAVDAATVADTGVLFELVRVVADADTGRLRDRVMAGVFINPDNTALAAEESGVFTDAAAVGLSGGSVPAAAATAVTGAGERGNPLTYYDHRIVNTTATTRVRDTSQHTSITVTAP